MATEPRAHVPHNALILVGDGQKALFLRNKGSPQRVRLVVERILERDNPPSRE
jgi:protein required for attachment to host cells